MKGRVRKWLSALLAAMCVVGTPGLAAAKRPITEKDLLSFVWVADPQISPDGSQVAYVRVSVDPEKKNYVTSLWVVPATGGEPRQLTVGTRDSSPRWSPDGRRLAFVRVAEKEGKPQPPQIYVLPLDGGEPQAITSLLKGASGPVWSPDGRSIAFTSSTVTRDLEKKDEKKDKKDEEESDVRVVTEAIYRLNGQGYLDWRRPDHIWTVAVPALGAKPATPKQLTDAPYDDGDLVWSKDGSQIYFTSDRRPESYYLPGDSDIYAVPAAGGSTTRIVSIDGDIGRLALSPDGRRLAFIGAITTPVLSYNEPDLFVVDLQPGAKPRNLTVEYDYDIGSGITGDQHPPRAGGGATRPLWTADGRGIIAVTTERGRANLRRFDTTTGQVSPFTEGDQEVVGYTATPGATKVAMLISNPTRVGDLFVSSGPLATPTQLTRANDTLFAELDLSAPEEITYKSFDGRPIQGWIQKPPGFDPRKQYPLILNIHGGPHAAYGYTFFHEMHWMAAKGYVVLYPNPRGSSSYGQEFGNVIQYHFPGDDYKDLMAGVDALLARGYVDPQRMGVTGGSGGGLLTNWTVTQTDRFRAAVSQRSIADWSGFFYNADFTMFTPFWFKGAPWQEEADFKARSPITHVERVKTPIMFVEGEDDLRTPPANGGEQMFRALKYLKRPTVMVRFPGETHELSRSGKPQHRIERLQHILNWFDKYLLGKPIKDYDPPYGEVKSEAATRN